MSFKPSASAEWRNLLRWTKNQHKVKLVAWKDPSTPFHFGRDDMSIGDTIQPYRLYLQRFRNGTQAVPYGFAETLYLLSFRPQRSGVEESTTLDNEPPQDKICNSGRFLDSLSLPRNDMAGGGSVCPYRFYLLRCMAMNHRRYIA